MNEGRVLFSTLCAIAALGMASCEKVKDLTSSAKSWIGDEEKEEVDAGDSTAEVNTVDKKQGEEIIASESRLVMVEYYSDT